MPSKRNTIHQTLKFYGLAIILSCFILLAYLYSHGFHLSIPIKYDQDNLFAAAEVKTVIDEGLSFRNPHIGAPFRYDLADFPISEGTSLVFMKILSLISGNFAVVMNLFFLLTFPLTTAIALYVLRYLGLNKPFGLAGSILFSFLPYHFLRMEFGHLFLIAYFAIPIYVLLAFFVLRDPIFFGAASSSRSKTKRLSLLLIYTLVCIFAASSGLYYAFFASFLLLVAGIVGSIEKKHWFPLANAGVFVLLISLTVIANTSPAITSRLEQGPNLDITQRASFEGEYYGLKITQLLLPTDHHPFKKFSNYKEYYNTSAPLVNENKTASLGIIGSIGFLLLLFSLLVKNIPYLNETLVDLSKFNISIVLFCTIGGFSSLFAYLISPMIRGYNRVSVFIAFFSVAAFFLVLQNLLKYKRPSLTARSLWIIATLVMVIGVYDEVPRMSFSDSQAEYLSDAKFVSTIENRMPTNSMIMQLPFAKFPENPAMYGMESYSLFRGYLHSHQLRWSFGAMRGRGTAIWQESESKKPIDVMLNDLAYAGFTGIYLFKNGYADHGQSIEDQLTHLLHTGPAIVNDSNDIIFYDLRPYIDNLRASTSPTVWQSNVTQALAAIDSSGNLRVDWGNGLYPLEQEANNTWHWSQKKSKVVIYVSNHPIQAKIKFQVKTGYAEDSTLLISGDLINETLHVNQTGKYVEENIAIPPGRHTIYFKTNAKQVNAGADPRSLFFAIYDFSLA